MKVHGSIFLLLFFATSSWTADLIVKPGSTTIYKIPDEVSSITVKCEGDENELPLCRTVLTAGCRKYNGSNFQIYIGKQVYKDACYTASDAHKRIKFLRSHEVCR